MLTQYHIEIMLNSFSDCFSPRALAAITNANIYQDNVNGQFGHDEYHFDNNAFEKTYAFLEAQRALTITSLKANDAPSAWAAFGRLTHTVQDFYSHTNYITLWLSRFNGNALPAPLEIDPIDPNLLHSPNLCSGKTYYPFELLYYIRSIRPYVLPFLPRDSHAWMNLDAPEQGFKFDYTMQAAIKRTKIEFDKTTTDFSDEMCRLFLDK